METTLEYYTRTTKSRYYSNRNQVGEKQCRCWEGSPGDSKSEHGGTRLFQYFTQDKKNSEVWLCPTCLVDVAEIDHMQRRREHFSMVSTIPEISIEAVQGEKTKDLILVIKWTDEDVLRTRCKAYPPF